MSYIFSYPVHSHHGQWLKQSAVEFLPGDPLVPGVVRNGVMVVMVAVVVS